jgi:predicted  nucleic acid-binding Zn-ribbon protein
MAGSVLSDEILESLEKIDQLAATAKDAEKLVAAGKQELEKSRQTVHDSAATIAGDIRRLETELAEAEKSLPADLKADYQRVIRSKGADGLASADDGVCSGCGQQMTLNMQNELRIARLVFCKSCGRILYLPGD